MGAQNVGAVGTIIKVASDTIANGTVYTPKLDAVAAAIGNLRAPMIRRMGVHVNASINTGTGPILQSQFLDYFKTITVRDKTGYRINWTSGLTWRNMLQTMGGLTYRDGPNTAVSQTGIAFKKTYWIPFIPRRVKRPSDFYIPATDLFTGYFQAQQGTPPFGNGAQMFTAVSGSLDFVIDVVDGGDFEAKSRLVHFSIQANSANFTYSLNGTLLTAYYWNGATNQKASTAYANQIITSNTLQINQIDSDVMQDLYEQYNLARYSDLATADQQDPVRQGFYLPIFIGEEFGSVSDMPNLTTLHYQTTGTVTSSTDEIELSYIEPRSLMHTASQLRVDPGKITSILALAYVPHANGRRTKVTTFGNFGGDLQNPVHRLPVRLPPDVQQKYAV